MPLRERQQTCWHGASHAAQLSVQADVPAAASRRQARGLAGALALKNSHLLEEYLE